MKTWLVIASLLLVSSPAFANCLYDNDGHVMCQQSSSVHRISKGLVMINTAAGPIKVNPSIAERMKGFIADVVSRGFKGRVHCFSTSHTHVRHSLHFTGRACDFAQRGWGKTVRVMYHVADLAAKWGLRDGCSFRGRRGPDCGHIDAGRPVTYSAHKKSRRRKGRRLLITDNRR